MKTREKELEALAHEVCDRDLWEMPAETRRREKFKNSLNLIFAFGLAVIVGGWLIFVLSDRTSPM